MVDRRISLLGAVLLIVTCSPACGARTNLGTGGGDGGGGGTADASWTKCGDASCNPSSEYCKEVIGGPPPGVDITSCEALPSGCHACSCLIQVECTCLDDTGHLSLTCNVP